MCNCFWWECGACDGYICSDCDYYLDPLTKNIEENYQNRIDKACQPVYDFYKEVFEKYKEGQDYLIKNEKK